MRIGREQIPVIGSQILGDEDVNDIVDYVL